MGRGFYFFMKLEEALDNLRVKYNSSFWIKEYDLAISFCKDYWNGKI